MLVFDSLELHSYNLSNYILIISRTTFLLFIHRPFLPTVHIHGGGARVVLYGLVLSGLVLSGLVCILREIWC
jgi:hypothetical protein